MDYIYPESYNTLANNMSWRDGITVLAPRDNTFMLLSSLTMTFPQVTAGPKRLKKHIEQTWTQVEGQNQTQATYNLKQSFSNPSKDPWACYKSPSFREVSYVIHYCARNWLMQWGLNIFLIICTCMCVHGHRSISLCPCILIQHLVH